MKLYKLHSDSIENVFMEVSMLVPHHCPKPNQSRCLGVEHFCKCRSDTRLLGWILDEVSPHSIRRPGSLELDILYRNRVGKGP